MEMGSVAFLQSVALPVICLGLAALILPRVLTPMDTRSHRRLAVSILVSALLLLLIGAALMAALYHNGGQPVGAVLTQAPAVGALFFLKRSAMAALVWGPVLALNWIGLAQRIEMLKSRDGMREESLK